MKYKWTETEEKKLTRCCVNARMNYSSAPDDDDDDDVDYEVVNAV